VPAYVVKHLFSQRAPSVLQNSRAEAKLLGFGTLTGMQMPTKENSRFDAFSGE